MTSEERAFSWDIVEATFRAESLRQNHLLPFVKLIQEIRRRGYDQSIEVSKLLDLLVLRHPTHPKLHVRLMTGRYDREKHPRISIYVDSAAPSMRVTTRLNGQSHDTIMNPIALNEELIAMLDALSNHSYNYLYEHMTLHPDE